MTTSQGSAAKATAAKIPARRTARHAALAMIYSYEQKGYHDDGQLYPFQEYRSLSDEQKAFAQELFDGFCAERSAVDAQIDERLNNWTIHRLAVVDRALLRLGCYEIVYCQDTPVTIIINECIEIAKEIGSDDKTPKLVNGVLDRLAKELRGN